MVAMTNLCGVLTYFVLIYIAFCNAGRSDLQEDQIKVAKFNVKPGGSEHTYETEWDGFECKFTYVCQGGTSEEWLAAMSRNNDQTQYTCTVERTDGNSYLFFQEFSMEIKGAKLEEVDVRSDKPLERREYTVDYDKGKVSQVNGEFQSKLNKVEVYVTRPKQEL